MSALVADHRWSVTDRRWLSAAEVADGGRRVPGTLLPGLRDHHVHLGLVEAAELTDSALSAVDDLGWIPDVALGWQRDGVAGCAVGVAGPFLTAPGGYPAGRAWAPAGSVLEVGSPEAAAAAVERLAGAGVAMIKIALNTAMPLLDDPTLCALVDTAHEHRLRAVVHAEGAGQPTRALAAGADALAHTPWTERLADELIEGLAAGLVIISTLAIFTDDAAGGVARDNLARFHLAGGRIRYGTDLGNGPGPVDVHPLEIEALLAAGLDVPDVLNAICRADGPPAWTPEPPPGGPEELAAWLLRVRRHPPAELREECDLEEAR